MVNLTEKSRLERQIQFLMELDKLKRVLRQTILLDKSRNENTAEHSWQLATATAVLAEFAAEKIDLGRALKMAIFHDVVEIDAGDTFVYDVAGMQSKKVRERDAADRIFGLLPEEQASEFRGLWDDFEALASAEARYVNALDRLLPMLQNAFSDGHSWKKHGVRLAQVHERNVAIQAESPELWAYAMALLDKAIADGNLRL